MSKGRAPSAAYVVLAAILLTTPGTTQAAKPTESEIHGLIDQLSTLGTKGIGYGLDNFIPVPTRDVLRVRPPSPPVEARHPALLKLVELGPRALPALLKRLDDKRETKLIATSEGLLGGMWHILELDHREDDAQEIATIRKAGLRLDDDENDDLGSIDRYTTTIGDACFVAIGMITNRAYLAVRGEPSGNLVVNSTAKNPILVKAVRALWQGQQPLEERHYQRLAADFLADGYTDTTAPRLLFYYPKRGTELVLARLEQLIAAGEDEKYTLQYLVNSISWCPVPKLRKRLQRLVLETADSTLITNGAQAFAVATPANYQHLVRLADKMRKLDRGSSGKDYDYASRQLLLVNLETFPARREETLRRFLTDSNALIQISCLLACYQVKQLPVAPLIPMLDVRAPGDDKYVITGPEVLDDPDRDDLRPYRICDNAYEVIARALGDHGAICMGTREEVDRQIQGLRQRLRGPAASWRFSAEEIKVREVARAVIKTRFTASQARIAKRAESKDESAALSIIAPATPDHVAKRAAIRLLTPRNWGPGDRVPRVLNNLELSPRGEDLSPDLRRAVGQALGRRLTAMLAEFPTRYPSHRACEFAGLLARWTKGKSRDLSKFTGQLMGNVAKKLHPRDRHLGLAFRVLDELIRLRHQGAARCVRALFLAIPAAELREEDALPNFLSILANHGDEPEVDKVLAAMLGDEESPWHLAHSRRYTPDLVGSMCDAGMLRTKRFRNALRAVLSQEYVIGHVVFDPKQPKSAHLDWALRADHTDLRIAPGEPRGKGRMLVHHRDVLLDHLANNAPRGTTRPAFRIYWPLAKRDQARQAWLKFVGRSR